MTGKKSDRRDDLVAAPFLAMGPAVPRLAADKGATVYLLGHESEEGVYIRKDDGIVWLRTVALGDRWFSVDAAAWAADEWEPDPGPSHDWEPAVAAGLTLIATWTSSGGVQEVTRPTELARHYLGWPVPALDSLE
ncbi:hypothetical protein F1D05_17785 [Kribbella qitaiheensis]|uniref:Uncharacterized protein n=1 Tax=Kribbella qitaiheensis TaxID=1544730 RepID=A0A7G6WZL6_9ACTN|nr:hypothetical protein [Kribbella qitaiheensis]QNE19431.1 hypothetical protein F1D05_17785 [Kribbella qitaiheensis]